jgi:hypothetical protein
MDDRLEDALREAEIRKATAEATSAEAKEAAQAETEAAEAILKEDQKRAALWLRPAEEAIDKLQRLGRPHITRDKAARLVYRGSSPLPPNMGLWGCDWPWHRGRRGGWAIHTRHPRADNVVSIFVPLVGRASVYKPLGEIDLHGYANQGRRESVWTPGGEGLPRRNVVDASVSLRQLIDVIADYIVTVVRA